MNIRLRIVPPSAVLLVAILVPQTGLAADDPKQAKNPSEVISVEEVQKLLDNLPANDKRQLADAAHSMMVYSYLARADETALANGQWLLMLRPERADDDLRQAKEIIGELHRRKVKGTFGKKPLEKLPAGFDSWAVAEKLSFLIDSLDEVDNSNLPPTVFEYPSGRDWRVEALIGIGDAAVPALIDTVERDERLTRLREPNPNRFTISWKIFRVRDTAMNALLAILRVHYFDRTQNEAFHNLSDAEGIHTTVAQLGAYWRTNSNLPFGERMTNVLTNPDASDEACREAAHNLASSGDDYIYGPLGIEIRTADKPPMDLAKFKNPTVGEAILSVLDRVSANRGEKLDKAPIGILSRQIEPDIAYLEPLVELRDKRMRPEFLRRYKSAPTLRKRMVWAVAANAIGDTGPIKELAGEFRDGKLITSREAQAGNARTGDVSRSDLISLVGCLTRIDLPETNQALFSAADPRHPLHDRVAREIAEIPPWQTPAFGEVCLDHPFCLAFLRHDLDDHTPTGGMYRIGGLPYSTTSSLTYGTPGTGNIGEIPDFLRDPATRRESAPELVCDRAAALIDELVFGMPVVHVHPLRKDHDERLKELIALVDRFHGRFRRTTSEEHRWVSWDVPFIADNALAGKTATVDDVNSGRAIFSLPGTRKPALIELPAAAMLKQSQKDAKPEPVLIVQAEVNADGQTIYGIIGRRFMRAAKAEELTDLKPIKPSDHVLTYRHAQ